jgi:hypothetical protein
MLDRVDCAKEWMRDGDQLLQRAGRRLSAFETDQDPIHIEMAHHDFSRAAQMYLTGAIEYQKGRDAVVGATAGLQEAGVLLQHLDGGLRAEAEAAWHSARHEQLSKLHDINNVLDPACTFAEALRDRLAHAVPELFDRAQSPSRSPDTATRSR